MAATLDSASDTIRPFKITVPDSHLSALRQKLESATFPDELNHERSQDWDMGAPLNDVKRLTAYWRDSFDWRKAEHELNESLPQYMTAVSVAGFDKIDIHFVHQKTQSSGPRPIPLLFLHGWPGSFIEVKKILPLLTRVVEDQPTFHVVAPSLPNFGFSGGVSKRGFGLAQYAESMHALMLRLGYKEYVVQGGDWGAIIARAIAIRYPDQVKALHLNFVPAPPPYPWQNTLLFLQALLGYLLPPFSQTNRRKIAVIQHYLDKGNAYAKQQDTFPQTLGYALHDSPVGLLAWVYEKLHGWTDDYPWTDDEVLQWVSIYAFSRAGPAASLRIYHESVVHPGKSDASDSPSVKDDSVAVTWLSRDQVFSSRIPDSVKIAVANFPKELIQTPSSWLKAIGNIVKETDYDKGGHFAAWEAPELLVQDLKALVGEFGGGYGVISSNDGH